MLQSPTPAGYSTRIPPFGYATLSVAGAGGMLGGFFTLYYAPESPLVGFMPLLMLGGVALFFYGMVVAMKFNFYGITSGEVVAAHYTPFGSEYPVKMAHEDLKAVQAGEKDSWELVRSL